MTRLTHPPVELKIQNVAAFVATAETSNISRAALLSGCSHSMLSRRIQELESVVQGRLFSRTGRGVQLTELGVSLLPQARALLSNVDQLLEQATSTIEHPAGSVRVALPRWAIDGPVSALAKQVTELYPKIRLVILEAYSDEVQDKLVAGKIDIGVFTSRAAEPPPHAQALFESELVLVGRPGAPLVAARTVPFAALHGVRMVLPPSPNYLEALLREVADATDIDLYIDLEINSGAMIREVVRCSNRYGISVIHALKSDLVVGGLGAARIVEPELRLHTYCATGPKHLITHASRAVEKCVVSVMMEHHQAIARVIRDE